MVLSQGASPTFNTYYLVDMYYFNRWDDILLYSTFGGVKSTPASCQF